MSQSSSSDIDTDTYIPRNVKLGRPSKTTSETQNLTKSSITLTTTPARSARVTRSATAVKGNEVVPLTKRRKTESTAIVVRDKSQESSSKIFSMLRDLKAELVSDKNVLMKFNESHFDNIAKMYITDFVKEIKEKKEKEIEAVKKRAYDAYMKEIQPIMSNFKTCQMTMCECAPGTEIKTLECKHEFCLSCYLALLEPKRNVVEYLVVKCPLCRAISKNPVPRYTGETDLELYTVSSDSDSDF